jgi:two-component system, OmpR family, osmolarity sensor histidine kinase EnvZ
MQIRPKSVLPRGLYGRAALILIIPVVMIQLVVSINFIQRHFEGVTRQMTQGLVPQIGILVARLAQVGPAGIEDAAALARGLDMDVTLAPDPAPATDRRDFWDLSGREVIVTLREQMPGLSAVVLVDGPPREVRLWLTAGGADYVVTVPRRRMSASNPHQLLVLMIATSVLMTMVAIYFLRLQLRPITRLALAAEAFGKGQVLPYRPRGAMEVRAAGKAFLDMRARIERQIESRTLMLSGISHDLRTPLTRLRLGLAMLPDDDETRALIADVAQMERMVDEFLAFVRGDAMEEAAPTDVVVLVRNVVDNAVRAGHDVRLLPGPMSELLSLRPMAVARALENLVGNAVRYGSRAEVSILAGDRVLRLVVEDDGPGIPKDRRDEAILPFSRLDSARDPNRGGGVGLGLSIAADVALSHGGQLRLGDSDRLGGLRAELALAR